MTLTNPAIELQTASPTDRIALRGVRLNAELVGMSMQATLEQTFVNLESKSIEAVYTLPETAAVCGFEVLTGDHVLTAKVDEADAALRNYDQAIAEGDAAFMLEQVRPDVFSARVRQSETSASGQNQNRLCRAFGTGRSFAAGSFSHDDRSTLRQLRRQQ